MEPLCSPQSDQSSSEDNLGGHSRTLYDVAALLSTEQALLREVLCKVGQDLLELLLEILAERALLVDLVEHGLLVALEVCNQISLPLSDLCDRDGVEDSVHARVDERHPVKQSAGHYEMKCKRRNGHLVDGHWSVFTSVSLSDERKGLTTHEYCFCFSNSVKRSPRLSVCFVAASRSDPN